MDIMPLHGNSNPNNFAQGSQVRPDPAQSGLLTSFSHQVATAAHPGSGNSYGGLYLHN